MAKKGKDDAPNPNSVANRDIIQRLNFLYQASVYLNTVSTAAPPVEPRRRSKKHKRRIATDQLSRTYISNMKVVGQKTTVKMDPAVKRTLCQGCNTVLIAGSTATIRVKKSPSHTHTMAYTCTHCQETRRIPAPPQSVEAVAGGKRMDVDMDQGVTQRSTKGSNRPPLPLRGNAGHVVFCGQDKIAPEDAFMGSGLFTVP